MRVLLLIVLLLAPTVLIAEEEIRCISGEFKPVDACYAQYCQTCMNSITDTEVVYCQKVLRPRTRCIFTNEVRQEIHYRVEKEERD